MPDPTLAFVAVATPGYYWDCAKALGKSLMEHTTSDNVRFHICPGEVGPWPTGTITRPKIILESWDMIEMLGADYLFCIDADARVEQALGDEILGEIVAVEHPGYVDHPCSVLPYDRSEISRAFIPMGSGERYYAGGLFGGEREAVYEILSEMAWMIEGPCPRWHDESCWNRLCIDMPPTKILSPAYCCPDDDRAYRAWWPEQYERIIVMLDKPSSVRGDR